MRNIEIKAKIKNLNEIDQIIKEKKLGNATLINQYDVFYNIPHGRLKLRKFKDKSAELIYYERSDQTGPKLSSYDKASLSAQSSDELSKVLERALGIFGKVKKTRHLYMLGQTRIHIDFVENLGNYLELEVVLEPEQSIDEGRQIAESIMKELKIDINDLISTAYVDLLNKS